MKFKNNIFSFLITFLLSISYSQTMINAIVVDPDNNYVKGAKVTFTSNVSSKSAYTNENGRVKLKIDSRFNPYFKDLNVFIEHDKYITRKYPVKLERGEKTLNLGILNFRESISKKYAAFARNLSLIHI